MIKWARPASIVARAVRLASNEAMALRLTGVAPFREVDVDPFIVDNWPAPELAPTDEPNNVAGPRAWSGDVVGPIRYHYTAEIENGTATAKGGVLTEDGGTIVKASHKVLDSPKRRRKLARWGTAIEPYRPLPRIVHYDQPVLAMTASNQLFYFHWLIDCLPRLLRVRAGLPADTLIYVDQTEDFQRESLALLGVPAERIIDAGRVDAVRSRRLIVPCHQIVYGHALPGWAVDALRVLIEPALKAASPGGAPMREAGRRLYISREDAPHRHMTNETELVSRLRLYGFESLQLSRLSFADQVVAFAQAEIVLSPNGSGLANLVFCRPGTRMVELLPRTNINVIRILSDSAGLDYGYLKSFSVNDDTEWNSRADYTIDVDLVEEFLARHFDREAG